MDVRDVPIEMFELKENVMHFAWEPRGTRFAVVHSTVDSKANVSIYDMSASQTSQRTKKKKDCHKMELLYTMEGKQCNKVYWSPKGRHCVLAGQASPHNGILEFFDVTDNKSLNQVEHFMCTDVCWDPSGRYVASVVSQPLFGAASMRHQLENGYALWNFQGGPLYRFQKSNFYQFLWRPRPKSLLNEKERKQVLSASNMKAKRQRYEQMDKYVTNSREAEDARNQIEKRDAFREKLAKRRNALLEKRDEYVRLVGWDDQDASLYDETREEVEELIEERTVEVPTKASLEAK